MVDDQDTALDVAIEQRDQPHLFRRDINVTNIVIDTDGLRRLFAIVFEANQTSIELQEAYEDAADYAGEEQLRATLRKIMTLGYSYRTEERHHAEGQGIPNIDHANFPEDISSIYISTSKIPQQLISKNPRNYVDIFLDFAKPPLSINLLHLPSNPTENGSVINVVGQDEAWVISTYEKLRTVLRMRGVNRCGLHGSGTYDFFLFLCFLPIWIWLLHRGEQYAFPEGLNASVLISVALVLYVFLLSLLFARFMFQYIRWLFPPVEYIARRQLKRYIHRGFFAALFGTIIFAAIYDAVKFMVVGE